MNKQRKVLITITYNEMGIIIDTKAEELDSSAQPEQRWIPCSERLPDVDGEYLITKKCFGWDCKEYYESYIAWYGKKGGWHKADEVIAWMLLPEPYREEGVEENR